MRFDTRSRKNLLKKENFIHNTFETSTGIYLKNAREFGGYRRIMYYDRMMIRDPLLRVTFREPNLAVYLIRTRSVLILSCSFGEFPLCCLNAVEREKKKGTISLACQESSLPYLISLFKLSRHFCISASFPSLFQ